MCRMNNIKFRSKDEEAFYHWCEDALNKGVINHFEYEPKTFLLIDRQTAPKKKWLKTKVKDIDKFLCHDLKYTPDFYIESYNNFDRQGLIYQDYDEDTGVFTYWIDVKGKFGRFHDDKQFSIIQKVFLFIHGIYANKLVIDSFFPKTFLPKRRKLKDDLIYTNIGFVRKRFE